MEDEAPKQQWRLRPARPDDADACAALAIIAWQRVHDAYAAILGPELHALLFSHWQEQKSSDVAGVVRKQPQRAMVAEADGIVIGFVTFRHDLERKVGEIGNNAVHPEWQGQGIATALYRAVLGGMRSAGLRGARVTTGLDSGHAPARAAYQKVGFAAGLPSITYYQDFDEPTGQTP